MAKSITVSIENVAETFAEDETGEMMAHFMAALMREFRGAQTEFAEWMQAAMNDAIALEAGDEWSDRFLHEVECAALDLFPAK